MTRNTCIANYNKGLRDAQAFNMDSDHARYKLRDGARQGSCPMSHAAIAVLC